VPRVILKKKLPWGAKIATVAKLRGRFCSFAKIATLEKLGAKNAIKPKYYICQKYKVM